ncbi:hypothetical protein JKP88DRAFT_271566 [Tribonema minus]|uniref:Cytidyltransferase-like domain-containing protein n=1 Tax=Tribonema minus TaxID=303371 RepID=A0A835ZEG0_9STRA|nr:hypothetical protein JKP88DRAFT_271566 [Tribonema minus]
MASAAPVAPAADRRLKVLLFGTSGNPPTGRGGHGGIVHYFCESGLYDEIWIMPVYRHMFSHKRTSMSQPGAATFDQRLEMCKLAFEQESCDTCCVKALPTEREVFDMLAAADPDPHAVERIRVCTYDVLKYLRKQHPDAEFSFVLGMDAYVDLLKGKWAHSKELLDETEFVVVDRRGVMPHHDAVPHGTHIHHVGDLTAVSSSAVRASDDLAFLQDPTALHHAVYSYMQAHGLYAFGRRRAARRQRAAAAAAAAVALGVVGAWAYRRWGARPASR